MIKLIYEFEVIFSFKLQLTLLPMIKPIITLILFLISWFFWPKTNPSPGSEDPFSGITMCHSNDDMAQFVNAPGFAAFHPLS